MSVFEVVWDDFLFQAGTLEFWAAVLVIWVVVYIGARVYASSQIARGSEPVVSAVAGVKVMLPIVLVVAIVAIYLLDRLSPGCAVGALIAVAVPLLAVAFLGKPVEGTQA